MNNILDKLTQRMWIAAALGKAAAATDEQLAELSTLLKIGRDDKIIHSSKPLGKSEAERLIRELTKKQNQQQKEI